MSGRGDGMSQALEVSVGPAWMTGGSLRSCSLDNFKKRLCLNSQGCVNRTCDARGRVSLL